LQKKNFWTFPQRGFPIAASLSEFPSASSEPSFAAKSHDVDSQSAWYDSFVSQEQFPPMSPPHDSGSIDPTELSAERAHRFPVGATVRLHDLDKDPYPILRRLQEEEPVSWIPEINLWFVTRRADINAILKDADTFTTQSPASPILDAFGLQMLSTDGPLRQKYKSQCVPPFTTTAVRGKAGQIEQDVNELVCRFEAKGAVDLRPHFAMLLSVQTITRVLGLPEEFAPQIRLWYDDFATALANFNRDPHIRHRGHAAAEEFRTEVRRLFPQLKRNLDESLLGKLLSEGGNRLSDEEILSNALIILFGGIETTESLILNAVWALLSHPEQLQEVLANPALVPAAIEESLRWEPAVQSCTRFVTRPVTLRGVDLQVGDVVQCMLGAANRDPAWISQPDSFDIHRPHAAEHVSFGTGPHFCLGAPLARLEGEISLRILLQRLTGLTLDPAHPSAPRGYEFRKPPELFVRWSTA
jgi:cytochrome P450